MGGILIEEDLYVKHRIVPPNTPNGQKIHAFFLARAKALAGKYIDFDKTPITFLLSNDDEPNAFFMRVQEHIDAGYKDYYPGKTVQKKYQQKIANMAEAIIAEAQAERPERTDISLPPPIDARKLIVYLRDKAGWLQDIFRTTSEEDGERGVSSFVKKPANMNGKKTSVGMMM